MKPVILLLILLSVTCSGLAQISLKHGMSTKAIQDAIASSVPKAIPVVAANFSIWLGLILYGISVVLWLGVLARVDVSQAYPFVGLAFLVTMGFAIALLGEAVSLYRVAGTVLIVLGVSLVARG